MISLPLSALLDRLSFALPKQVPIFLVGGAIRDALLNRASQDLDFIVHGDARKTARSFANALGADYYPLSNTIDAGRVLYTFPSDRNREQETHRYVFDFTGLRAANLENDLRERDFTINAIAMDIKTKQIIDPLHGGRDLKDKIIRACCQDSFNADPVRILRAVRLANQLGFHIERNTLNWLREALPFIKECSAERIREEIQRILGGKSPESALRIMDSLNILKEIMPELANLKGVKQPSPHVHDVWNHTLSLLAKLNVLIDILSPDFIPDGEAGYSTNLIMGMAAISLGRFRKKLGEHFANTDYPAFSQRALLLFGALYHDAGKPQTITEGEDGRINFYNHEQVGADLVSQRAHMLHMSNADSDYLKTIVLHHLRPYFLVLRNTPPTRRAIYRFFRDTGPAGIDICLLALADFLAIYEHSTSQTAWANYLDVIVTLLDNWWFHKKENIDPPPLLNGIDLIEQFNLPPGPLIGKLLAQVREDQATGVIQTRTEALKSVSKRLATMNVKKSSDN